MGSKERIYADVMAVHPEVTGSCIFVHVRFPDGRRTRFLVDCGLFQEKQLEVCNENFPFDPKGIDFGLITHNHVDHIGRIPLLVKRGYSKEIFATDVTQRLMPLALKDSVKVLTESAKRKKQKSLYSDSDVLDALSHVHGVKFGETIEVAPYIKATFFNNGHLIGAALILVQIQYPGLNSINLLFTGDYNFKNEFLDLTPLPEWIYNLPITIIQESTYGYMDSSDIHPCFRKNITKALDEGKTILVPAFSLGRAQEILYELKKMQNEGILDITVPIYFDGKLAFKYTNLYLNADLNLKEGMKNFMPESVTYVDKNSRNNVITQNGRKIIVATSGMGSYGPAATYIPALVGRSDVLLHFTGYMAEGTLGRKLSTAPKGEIVDLNGFKVPRNADIEYTTEYSAHAKADGLIDFLKKFNHLNVVLVNHGETKTKDIYSDKVLNEVNTKFVGILGNGSSFRINPFGLVETKIAMFQ